MPKIWGFLIALIIGFALFMVGLNLLAKIEGKVYAPGAASELVGKNYFVVEHQFEDAGFSDIRLVELDTEDAAMSGRVSEVSIAGQSDFNSGMYKKDSIVRIYYYTE